MAAAGAAPRHARVRGSLAAACVCLGPPPQQMGGRVHRRMDIRRAAGPAPGPQPWCPARYFKQIWAFLAYAFSKLHLLVCTRAFLPPRHVQTRQQQSRAAGPGFQAPLPLQLLARTTPAAAERARLRPPSRSQRRGHCERRPARRAVCGAPAGRPQPCLYLPTPWDANALRHGLASAHRTPRPGVSVLLEPVLLEPGSMPLEHCPRS